MFVITVTFEIGVCTLEDLIKMVSEKTGITPEQSKGAVDTVINYLKDKVPALGASLEGLTSGGGSNVVDEAKSKLGI